MCSQLRPGRDQAPCVMRCKLVLVGEPFHATNPENRIVSGCWKDVLTSSLEITAPRWLRQFLYLHIMGQPESKFVRSQFQLPLPNPAVSLLRQLLLLTFFRRKLDTTSSRSHASMSLKAPSEEYTHDTVRLVWDSTNRIKLAAIEHESGPTLWIL